MGNPWWIAELIQRKIWRKAFSPLQIFQRYKNGFFFTQNLGRMCCQQSKFFEYAKVLIWEWWHYKRCSWPPLPLLVPTPVSELTVSLLATISAVPQGVLSAQLLEERKELCCEARNFYNCLCPQNQHLQTPGRLPVQVLYTHVHHFWIILFLQDVSCVLSCFFCKGIIFKMSITVFQASQNEIQLMSPGSVFWHKINLVFVLLKKKCSPSVFLNTF